jgi:hypothetical protein
MAKLQNFNKLKLNKFSIFETFAAMTFCQFAASSTCKIFIISIGAILVSLPG